MAPTPVYGAGDMTVRGSKRWARDEAVKPSRPLYIIDGALVDARKFFDTDINDVRQIIIRKDPGFRWPNTVSGALTASWR